MAIVSYDVSGNQSDVKAAMVELGYVDSWTVDGEPQWLPESTLWKPETTCRQALKDIKAAATDAGVRVERAVASEEGTSVAIPGEELK